MHAISPARRGRGLVGGAVATVWGVVVALCAAAGTSSPGQVLPGFGGELDAHPAIGYATRPTTDRVAALNQALLAGTKTLQADRQAGFLPSVLDALDVSPASQLLVFSKTGIQRTHTSPHTPRALYFSDSVVVGYIPGAPLIEVAAHDPQQGTIFYTLDQTAATPRFTRGTGCLTCHVSPSTLDVPGMIARSHGVDSAGVVVPTAPVVAVSHETPHTERWGGWFVTSNAAAPPYSQGAHRGNLAAAASGPSAPAISSNHVFVAWLDSTPEQRGYPSAASDAAALLAFDHQMHAMNLLTRLNWDTRVAVSDGPAWRQVVAARVREVADYLLFAGEASFAAALTPRPDFAASLAARVPRDRRGRSFGQLDLTTRLLRYPCSYMIYAPAFDALPRPVRDAVYRRMLAVLSGRVTGARHAHLTRRLRREVTDILRDTKPGFPGYRGDAGASGRARATGTVVGR